MKENYESLQDVTDQIAMQYGRMLSTFRGMPRHIQERMLSEFEARYFEMKELTRKQLLTQGERLEKLKGTALGELALISEQDALVVSAIMLKEFKKMIVECRSILQPGYTADQHGEDL